MDDASLKKGMDKITLSSHPVGWMKSFLAIARLSWQTDKSLNAVYLKPNGSIVFAEGSRALECFRKAVEAKDLKMTVEDATEDDLK